VTSLLTPLKITGFVIELGALNIRVTKSNVAQRSRVNRS